MSDRDVNVIFIQLIDQARKGVELRISEEFNEMGPITWRNVVALEMAADVAEGDRIAVDVESFNLVAWIAGLLGDAGALELAEEVLGEVGGCLWMFSRLCFDNRYKMRIGVDLAKRSLAGERKPQFTRDE